MLAFSSVYKGQTSKGKGNFSSHPVLSVFLYSLLTYICPSTMNKLENLGNSGDGDMLDKGVVAGEKKEGLDNVVRPALHFYLYLYHPILRLILPLSRALRQRKRSVTAFEPDIRTQLVGY